MKRRTLTKPNPVSARAVQVRLFYELRSSCSIAAPNYTPKNWFECDLFSVSKSGYFHEHEIKLTRQDYRADQGKVLGVLNKHQALAEGYTRGPSRFWFVLPEGLVSEQEIPAWAGLKIFSRRTYQGLPAVRIAKPAPQLHRKPVEPREVDRVRLNMYWRYWWLLAGVEQGREAVA